MSDHKSEAGKYSERGSLANRLSNVFALVVGAAGVRWSGPQYQFIFEWITYAGALWLVGTTFYELIKRGHRGTIVSICLCIPWVVGLSWLASGRDWAVATAIFNSNSNSASQIQTASGAPSSNLQGKWVSVVGGNIGGSINFKNVDHGAAFWNQVHGPGASINVEDSSHISVHENDVNAPSYPQVTGPKPGEPIKTVPNETMSAAPPELSQEEKNRRHSLLLRFASEYHNGAQLIIGHAPGSYINKRLTEMGENWRVPDSFGTGGGAGQYFGFGNTFIGSGVSGRNVKKFGATENLVIGPNPTINVEDADEANIDRNAIISAPPAAREK
jgi:hypothetical protein